MSIDTGDETTDEKQRPRRQAVPLIPRAKPGQVQEPPADSSSGEAVGPAAPMKKNIACGPQEKAGKTRGAPLLARLGRLRYYGLALLLVGVATLLRWTLRDVLNPTPFLIFYLAWVAAAAFGGLGPGLLATLASWLCVELLFDYGPGHIGFSDLMSLARLLIFLGGGLVVSVVGEAMRRSRIRERRQTEKLAAANAALEEREARLAKAEAIARLGNWEVDARTDRVRGSQELYRLFDLEPDANLDAYIEKFHPEDRQRVIASIKAAVEEDKPYSLDYRIVPSPGVLRYVHAEGTVTRDSRGLPITFFGTVQDITERKQAEEALRASEEKYRFLVEASKDAIWMVDRQGRWTFISGNIEKTTGYRADELIGKAIWDFLTPESRALVQDKWRRRLRGEDLPPYEVVFVGKDGHPRPFEVLTASIIGAGGKIVGVQGVSRDITERKRAEETLRASEEKYRFLVENSKDVTWSMDLQGRWTFISSNVEKVAGYRADEVIGRTLWDFLAPECHDLVKERLRRRLRGEDLPPYEIMIIGKDGRHIPFEVLVASIVDDGGNIVGLQGVSRDITERKRAEAALRESEYHLAQAQQIAHLGSWSWDLADNRLYWSDEIYRLYGLQPGESEPRHEAFLGFVHPEDRPRVQQCVQEALARGGSYRLDFRIIQKGGQERYVHCEAQVVLDREGHPVKAEGALQDITERKQAEAALRESEQRYRGIVEDQTELICLFGYDQTISFVNDAYCRYFGKKQEELVGHQFLPLIDEEDREVVKAQIAALGPENPVVTIEQRVWRPDGSIAWQEWKNRAVFDEQGHLTGYQAVGRDITERKRAEEAVAESRKKYCGLVEKINDWVWEIDADGVYTYASPHALELLGYAPEEIVGKTPFDFMPPAEAERVWNAFQPIWLERKPLELMENTLVRKDGRLVTVETSGMPVFAEDGSFRGYTGVDRDVTERKRAEETLRESEERFRTAFEEGSVAMALTALDSTLLKVNSRFCRMLGFSEPELIGRSYLEITHPDDRAANLVGTRQLASGEISSFHMEKRYVRKDGAVLWADMNTAAVQDAQGRPLYCVTHVQDITERKQAEEALRESRRRLERAQEIAHLGSWELDLASHRLTWSDEVYRIFGLQPREFAATYEAFLDRVHPEDRAAVDAAYSGSLREGRDTYEIEHRIVRKSTGEIRLVHEKCDHVRDASGRIIRSIGMVHDITERKQAEQELRELNATLETRVARRTAQLQYRARQLQKLTLELTEAEERERKRLAGILHDDLQQVLAAAKFQVGLLSSRVRNDAESHEIAEQSKGLLGDAIAKSRSLSHELSAPGLSRSNLVEAFEWLAEQMQQKHRFTVHLEIGEQIEVASEPLRVLLYKAAQELLFNVIKHAGVHEAKLRLRHRRGRFRLLVSDTGRGFDSTESGGNLGFGLLSIRERAEYLGGRMKIRSAPGKGSIFVVAVPDAEAAP